MDILARQRKDEGNPATNGGQDCGHSYDQGILGSQQESTTGMAGSGENLLIDHMDSYQHTFPEMVIRCMFTARSLFSR